MYFQDNQVVGIGSGTTVISAVESLGKSTTVKPV